MKTAHVGFKSKSGERGRFFPEINRSEVARKTGMDRSTVSQILSGVETPGMESLKKLARVFRVDTDELDKRLASIRRSRRKK